MTVRLQTVALLLITLAGFALRVYYLTTAHPFFDEYTTVLAARQILRHGWPVLPSGLFYEHGLLSTYLIAPFTALFINTPLAEWQSAHWGLMLSRWPSVLLGTLTIPLIYTIGRRTTVSINRKSKIQNPKWLLAAGLFALSPEGMVWGGRARMYALATLLVLLTVYWAYRGAVYPAPSKYRWWALITLLATLLTQFGALMIVPPLVVAMLAVAWLSWPKSHESQANSRSFFRLRRYAPGIWCFRPAILVEGATLAIVVGLAILVKRLGRPLGTANLTEAEGGNLLVELINTVTYQTAFFFTWPETLKFLARQFGIPHHLWLTLVTLIGAILGLGIFLLSKRQSLPPLPNPKSKTQNPKSLFPLFLWLIFGLIILQMITLLEPFRRNPRYIVMYLPLFYLLAVAAIYNYRVLLRPIFSRLSLGTLINQERLQTLTALLLLALFTIIGFSDLQIALNTPEPAYEEALAFVYADWRPGDTLLTMNTPAAGLYLEQVDGFTIQADAEQFLLNKDVAPVDRWLGSPWLGDVADLNTALNVGERSWFIIDTIRQPIYFRGDWLAFVNNQMEQVWAKDNVLVYRTRPNRTVLPTQPDILINATLSDPTHDPAIELIGYSFQGGVNQPASAQLSPQLTLFWQALTRLPSDYTVFLHLRDGAGVTVAQRDGMPVEGSYPTSRWQPGETVIDPITLSLPENLPAGNYQFYVGLYRLETLERLAVANDLSGENAIFLGEISLP